MDMKETAVPRSDGQLAEVWGDVVSRRHLGRAIVIGGVVSLGFYGLGLLVLTPLAETPQIGRALAMLLGIVGCIAGGAICARVFPPKRHLSEDAGTGDAEWQQQVLDRIEAEGGTIGDLSDLPPETLAELHDTGLHDLFRDRAARSRNSGEA